MQKNKNNKNSTQPTQNATKRETKILNIVCNTTILLLSMMTEAISGIFSSMSKEMVNAFTTGFGAPEDTRGEINEKTKDVQQEIPKQMREQVLSVKADIAAQLKEKKEQIIPILADKKFDEGIAIVERYEFGLPRLSCELDERALLGYLALMQQNNEQFTKMFQELLEWMKNVPQS
jgi:hypothetical protein